MKNKNLHLLILLFALSITLLTAQTTIFFKTMGNSDGTAAISVHETHTDYYASVYKFIGQKL